MTPRIRQTLAATGVAAGALLVSHSASPAAALLAAPADPPTQLAGTWILNKDLGSDPLGELDTRRPSRPYGAGGMATPGTGTGLGGPLMGGRRAQDRADQEELAKVKEMLRITMAAPAKIEIAVDGPAIEVLGDDGTVQRLRADGKKVSDRSYAGLDLERKTKWDGSVLVTELALKDSEAKAKQTWTREGARLEVLTKLSPPHGGEPLEVRRVYELESPPGSR
jgi:hypothetical protein